MALAVIALVAQQRHGAGRGACQRVEQCALGGQVLTEIREEAREIAIVAQSMPKRARRAERAFMGIGDAGIGQCR